MPQTVRLVQPAVQSDGFLGSFHLVAPFTTAASPTANSPYFSLRWAPTSGQLFVLTKADLRIIGVAVGGTGSPFIGAFVARSFTAADSGGTAISFAGNNQKKRTGSPSSLVADARFGLGTALTPGTRTIDGLPFIGTVNNAVGGGSFEAAQGPSLDLVSDPITLVSGEGIELLNVNALTTVTLRGVLSLNWSEYVAGSAI